ncbi:MAG: WecB/TagA/CpsF family glycosyltransferase, partial [Nitrospirales bacterium]
MLRMDDVVSIMADWIESESDQLHHVVNTGMHGIMEAHKDEAFGGILNSVDLLAPDGILAILVARIHGYRIEKKETGPELLWRFSEAAHRKGYKYFLYGDTAETLELLSAKLTAEFPNLKIVGCQSPPFRNLTKEEETAM